MNFEIKETGDIQYEDPLFDLALPQPINIYSVFNENDTEIDNFFKDNLLENEELIKNDLLLNDNMNTEDFLNNDDVMTKEKVLCGDVMLDHDKMLDVLISNDDNVIAIGDMPVDNMGYNIDQKTDNTMITASECFDFFSKNIKRRENSLTYKKKNTNKKNLIFTNKINDFFVKPKFSFIYWDSEKTICYQVRVNRIIISRRDDNNYINATKLLNLIGMTRGRRDGILKAEKKKNIVKVGSMILKGIWIPFNRAYEIARSEGVDKYLDPLFDTDIKKFFNDQLKGSMDLKTIEN